MILRSHQHPIRLAMTTVRHSDSVSVDPRQAVRVSRPRKCRSFSDALNVPFVSPNSIVEFVYGRSPPDLVSENLACADGSTPRFLLLSPTSDRLGTIGETPLVHLFVVYTCRKTVGQHEEGGESTIPKVHLPCGGNMMLMDGQLSHTGLDTRCRLLSALLGDDEAGDEDIDQTG